MTQQRLTKRQREVAEMMRNGWNLQVKASRTKSGEHKPLLVYWENEHSYKTVKVSFSVIDALQRAHVIRPVKSIDNERVWIYQLTEGEDTKTEASR